MHGGHISLLKNWVRLICIDITKSIKIIQTIFDIKILGTRLLFNLVIICFAWKKLPEFQGLQGIDKIRNLND